MLTYTSERTFKIVHTVRASWRDQSCRHVRSLCRAKFAMNYEYIESVLRERCLKRKRMIAEKGWKQERGGESRVPITHQIMSGQKSKTEKSFSPHYFFWQNFLPITSQECVKLYPWFSNLWGSSNILILQKSRKYLRSRTNLR